MKAPDKKSSILAAIIWLIGIVLAFKIPAGNKLVWLSDTLLLLGFYPLLISIKSPWLWFIFGLIDTFIAVILLIVLSAPKEELIHLHALEMKAHIENYHPYYVWAIIGVLSVIIGLTQLLFKLFICLYSLVRNK